MSRSKASTTWGLLWLLVVAASGLLPASHAAAEPEGPSAASNALYASPLSLTSMGGISSASDMGGLMLLAPMFAKDPKLMNWWGDMGSNNWAATLFWPSNKALEGFAASMGYTAPVLLTAFNNSPSEFWSLMSNQIVGGANVSTAKFTEGQHLTALGGAKLTLSKGSSGAWTINGISSITEPDIQAGSAVLHVVDAFATPPNKTVWQPLLAAAAAATAAPSSSSSSSSAAGQPAPAAASGGGGITPGARIGISIGASLGLAMLVTLISLLCVMFRRRRQQAGSDPWAVNTAPRHVRAAAAATSRWQHNRRRGCLGFKRGLAAQVGSSSSGGGLLGLLGLRRHRGTTPTAKVADGGGRDPTIGSGGVSGGGGGVIGLTAGANALCVVGSGALIAPLPSGDTANDSSSDDDEEAGGGRGRRLRNPHHSSGGGGLHNRDVAASEARDTFPEEAEMTNQGLGMMSHRDVEQGFGSAGLNPGSMGMMVPPAAAAAGSWGSDGSAAWQQHQQQQWQQQRWQQQQQGMGPNGLLVSQYPMVQGGLLRRDTAGAGLTPAVTPDKLSSFMEHWQAAGSPGGRVLALPMFSEVAPNPKPSPGSLNPAKPSLPGSSLNPGGDCKTKTPTDGGAGEADQQGVGGAGGLAGAGGGCGAGAGAAAGVAQLGSFAVAALQPGGVGQQLPLLRQVLADLASGRHPVTHNFCMEEHQTPIARHNTVVLFAHNKNNIKRVTIKFYSPRSAGYAAETSAYYRMASRHLPFLESTFNSPDGSYASALVMEWGERTLREMLGEHRPTDLPRKIEMFHQLVLAVRHMHSHNLVHRDLQPKHLLFCSEGMAWKLIDFSTTVAANSMVVPEVFSLEYCAPEVAEAVARGDRGVVACAAADMWSVGVMAYEMATGQSFYPATWSNEEIWRALLGLSPLPSEALDIVAAAAPGEKAFMKKVANLLQRNPLLRMTSERLASSRLFSACAATTTNVPLHAVQQQQQLIDGGDSSSSSREIFKRLGSITRTLERLGFRVEESNALGVNILKEMTVNSLILSVNLHELKPRTPPHMQPQNPRAEGLGPNPQLSQNPRAETIPPGAQQGQQLGFSMAVGQAGALGLVDKSPAPLADDGAGNPIFYLRQGSCYLVEITVMQAKGQQLPDQTAVESLQIEAPDGSKQTLALGPTCRGKNQLMVSAVWEPSSSRSKLVSGVTPKKLWGKEGSVPLNLSICLTMCLLPEQGPLLPPSGSAAAAAAAAAAATLSLMSGTSIGGPYGGSSSSGFNPSVSNGGLANNSRSAAAAAAGSTASLSSWHSCASQSLVPSSAGSSVPGFGTGSSVGAWFSSSSSAAAAGFGAVGMGSRFGQVEPVWVQSELVMRMFPAGASFKAARTFRYVEECWQALPPEARGVMQGLVLLVRGVAGGASAFATMMH